MKRKPNRWRTHLARRRFGLDVHAMSDRPWYREPETFIALAALVVSVSAVVVGIYEASLQRAHDRAEMWPQIQVATITNAKTAQIYVENSGVGPALITSIIVSVDGKRQRTWPDAWTTVLGHAPKEYSNYTIGARTMRPGERQLVSGIPIDEFSRGFWIDAPRVGIRICYGSVFGEHWLLDAPRLDGRFAIHPVKACAEQPDSTDF